MQQCIPADRDWNARLVLVRAFDPLDDPGLPPVIVKHDIVSDFHLFGQFVHKDLERTVFCPVADKFQSLIGILFPDKL